MKTILSIWNTGKKGKTETLREFANLLISTYPSFKLVYPGTINIPSTTDFRLVVEINGKIVGIESQGDPNTELGKRLIDLADNFKCDIILCSCRTRGETVEAVNNLVKTRNFKTIWTSTYQIEDITLHQFVNQLKAKHIMELLVSIKLI